MSESNDQGLIRNIKVDLLLKLLSVSVIPLFLYLRDVEGQLIQSRERVQQMAQSHGKLVERADDLESRLNKINLIANEAIVSLGFVRETLVEIKGSLHHHSPVRGGSRRTP
jgi:hypothetical protein